MFYHSFHSIIDVSFGLQQNNIHYTLANYSSNVMHFICYSFIFYFTYFPTELRNAASDVASSSCLHNIKIQQKHFTDLIIIVYKTCMPQHTKNVTRKFLYVVQIVSKYVSLLLIYFWCMSSGFIKYKGFSYFLSHFYSAFQAKYFSYSATSIRSSSYIFY